jgi:hypothetical protein
MADNIQKTNEAERRGVNSTETCPVCGCTGFVQSVNEEHRRRWPNAGLGEDCHFCRNCGHHWPGECDCCTCEHRRKGSQ